MKKTMMSTTRDSDNVISFDEWIEQYRPVMNEIVPNDVWDGYLFEADGAELAFVEKQDPN